MLGRWTSGGALAAAGTAVLACAACDEHVAARHAYAADSLGTPPASVFVVPLRAPPALRENSGAALSATQPGVFFTINDSGNEPVLFAFDTTGAPRGAWRVSGATNIDWEAIAPGPCPPDSTGEAAGTARATGRVCLIIGDVGDNNARQPTRTLYAVAEPATSSSGKLGRVRARALDFRYADGAHDVEAIFVTGDGAVHLITKRPSWTPSGRLRPALVFRIAPSAWIGASPAIAELDDSVSVVPGSALLRVVTDAALSPGGTRLAVRTYAQVYVFAVDSAGHARAAPPLALCNVFPLAERAGEGITWVAPDRLLLTSEGRDEPIRLLTCPER